MHVSLVDIVSRRLTFNWGSVAPDCLSLHYNILSSNCGSCPTTTTNTTVTCTDVPVGVSDLMLCNFSVQATSCGKIISLYKNDPVGIFEERSITTQDLIQLTSDSVSLPKHILGLISVSVLALLMTISTVVLATTVVLLLKRKSKIQAELDQEKKQRSGEEIIASENVAYGHLQSIKK